MLSGVNLLACFPTYRFCLSLNVGQYNDKSPFDDVSRSQSPTRFLKCNMRYCANFVWVSEGLAHVSHVNVVKDMQTSIFINSKY